MKELGPEEAKRMSDGPLRRELAAVAPSYAAALFWAVRQSTDGMDDELRNGTTFFLNCGSGTFGVTAGHVYDEFAQWARNGGRCQIGRSPQLFDLRERLIARGKEVDIATYKISESEIAAVGVNILTGYQRQWPPKPAEEGKELYFAGFPGVKRRMVGRRKVLFGYFTGAGVADSVSDRDVSCLVPWDDMVRIDGLSLPALGDNFGGLSGGPLLALVGDDVVGWRLAGVIYECEMQSFGLIKAVRAKYIRQDGTLEG